MSPAHLFTNEWPPSGVSNGRVAFLVHGVTGWHRTWWRLGTALSERGWRVVAVDQRGHGRSPRIHGAVAVDDLADDLRAAIEREAAPPIDLLVGHSLGAAVSLRLANRHPELLRRLVLEDPPSIDRVGDRAFLDDIRRRIAAAREAPEGERERMHTENPLWLEEDVRQEVEGRALADADGIVASLDRPRGFRVVDLAPDLQVPTLYLLADEQRSALVGDARRQLERRLPTNARIAEFDAGHTVHRDRFAEYLRAVLDWAEAPG